MRQIDDIKIAKIKKYLERHGFNHVTAGDAFAIAFGDIIKYMSLQNQYMIWNSKKGIWEQDYKKRVHEYAKYFVIKIIPKILEMLTDERILAQGRKWGEQMKNNGQRGEMLKSFQSKPSVIVEMSDFDRHPQYLNLKNGVYDFKTMTLLPHNKEFMLTKQANVSYDQDADCERFRKFIFEVSDNDKALAKYIQMVLGYALSGALIEHCIFLLIGVTTRNGKSTLVNTLANMMDDYAVNAQPETFALQRKNSSNASPDIARLANARIITVAEPPIRMVLDVAKIKAFTGEDKISARDLYSGIFEFEAQGTIIMHSNHFPKINDNTLFMSNRIISIPFDVSFPPDQQDSNLANEFSEEEAKAGILNFILKGYELYCKKGLKEQPARIKRLIREYQRNSDPFGAFLKEKIVQSTGKKVKTNMLFMVYNRWANKNGYPSLTNIAVTKEMKARGYVVRHKSDGNVFMDIDFKK